MITWFKKYWRYWAFKFVLFTILFFCFFVLFAVLTKTTHILPPSFIVVASFLGALLISWSEQNHQKNADERDAVEQRIAKRRVDELKHYGEERAQNEVHHITIETNVPSKWIFTDRENNKCYVWRDGALVEATNVHVNL